MKKAICSDAKDSSGKPMWLIMPDGSFFISQKAVDQASIQHLKLKSYFPSTA
ncbi:MAG: hypothetical protein LKM38_02660 [Pseudomonas veronii]|jgi:hypothetical protein|nr:hypothetical protein [Pseudomonas veronii]